MKSASIALPRRVIDLRGRRFGRLVVRRFSHTRIRRAYWECVCDCGNVTIVRAGDLNSERTKSCGCLHLEILKARTGKKCPSYIHGHAIHGATSSEYRSWFAMIQRCEYKKNIGYKYYGGRGITICRRWRHSFPNFLEDMGSKPTTKHSLDRIDNEGNYEPGNCRWATAKEQALNRRKPKCLPRIWTQDGIATAIRLRKAGKTCVAIGKMLSVHRATISRVTKA